MVSKNYLAYARVFARSFRERHADVPVFVLLVDAVDGCFDPATEPFSVVLAEELANLPDPHQVFFKYDVLELNTALKPYFFELLFERHGLRKLVYFDPDILVVSPVDRLFELLDVHAALLTPHLLDPIEDEQRPSEVDILRAGVYNLGFLGLSARPATRALLSWWKRRLYAGCFVDPDRGYFVDQRWMDLAPALFEGVHVLREPEWNVAYWNLHALAPRIASVESAPTVDGRPLGFFHFSGFDAERAGEVSKHQDRFKMADVPHLRPLFDRYRALLFAEGHREVRKLPYAYERFEDGAGVPPEARRLFRRLGTEARRFGDPFRTRGEGAFVTWLNDPVEAAPPSGTPPITRLAYEIYGARSDVRREFPDVFGADRARFIDWLRTSGKTEHRLDPVFTGEAVAPRVTAAAIGAAGARDATAAPDPVDAASAAEAGTASTPTLPAATTVSPRPARRTVVVSLIRCVRFTKGLFKPLERVLPANGVVRRSVSALNRRLERIEAGPARLPPPALPPVPAQLRAPPARARTGGFGVNLAGYFTGEFGVAEAARALALGLRAADVPLALNNLESPWHRHEDRSLRGFTRQRPYRYNVVHVNADQAAAVHEQLGAETARGRYNIGVWYWELARFPDRWRSAFAPYDEIWVTSGFCQAAIAAASPVPVVKVPVPIVLDAARTGPDRARFGIAPGALAFLVAFDHLSVLERKNPLGAIEAFRRAFSGRRDVCLVLKSINGDHAPESAARLRGAIEGLPVHVIDEHLAARDVTCLLASCDAFISLHRSEGLGLFIAKSMLLGKPVVATAYSGSMEFTDPGNSYLVRYRLTEIERDLGAYRRGDVWAEPDVDHAVELLRQIAADRGAAALVGRRAAEDIRARFDPVVVGRALRDRIERLDAG